MASRVFLTLSLLYLLGMGWVAKTMFVMYKSTGVPIALPLTILVIFFAGVTFFTLFKERFSNKRHVFLWNVATFVFLVFVGSPIIIGLCWLPLYFSGKSAINNEQFLNEGNALSFGQVWQANRDYEITEWFNEYQGHIIPRGTRVVVLTPPLEGAFGFTVMVLDTAAVDPILLPSSEIMEQLKDGFGIPLGTTLFFESFEQLEDQEVVFDHSASQEFFNTLNK